MKTYQDKRTLNEREWDVMVAEEGDHKVFVPFFCPPGQDPEPFVEKAQRMAEVGLRHERQEQGATP